MFSLTLDSGLRSFGLTSRRAKSLLSTRVYLVGMLINLFISMIHCQQIPMKDAASLLPSSMTNPSMLTSEELFPYFEGKVPFGHPLDPLNQNQVKSLEDVESPLNHLDISSFLASSQPIFSIPSSNLPPTSKTTFFSSSQIYLNNGTDPDYSNSDSNSFNQRIPLNASRLTENSSQLNSTTCQRPSLLAQSLLINDMSVLFGEEFQGTSVTVNGSSQATHYRVILSTLDPLAGHPCSHIPIYIAASRNVSLQIQDHDLENVKDGSISTVCLSLKLTPGTNVTLITNEYGRVDFSILLPSSDQILLSDLQVPEFFIWTRDMVSDMEKQARFEETQELRNSKYKFWKSKSKSPSLLNVQGLMNSSEISKRAIVFNPFLSPMHDMALVTSDVIQASVLDDHYIDSSTAHHLSDFIRRMAHHVGSSQPKSIYSPSVDSSSSPSIMQFESRHPYSRPLEAFDPQTQEIPTFQATSNVSGGMTSFGDQIDRIGPNLNPFTLDLIIKNIHQVNINLTPNEGLESLHTHLHRRGIHKAMGRLFNGTTSALNSLLNSVKRGTKGTVIKIQSLGHSLAVTIESHGGIVGRFLIKTVRQIMNVLNTVLRICFISTSKFIGNVGKTMNFQGLKRTAKFLHHFIRIRKDHMKDSMAHVGKKWTESSGNSTDNNLESLTFLIEKMKGKEVTVDHVIQGASKDGKSFTMNGVTVNTTDKAQWKPHDVRSSFVENQLLSSLTQSQLSDDTQGSSRSSIKRLQNIAGDFYRNVMVYMKDHDHKDILMDTQLIFEDGASFSDKSVAWVLHRVKRLVIVMKKAMAHIGALSLKAMSLMTDLFYTMFEWNILLPISLLIQRPIKLTFLELYCYFASPFVYFQYLGLKGEDPISEKDLQVLLTVKNPMLLRHVWNSDNPSLELVQKRDGILDWLPRSMLVTLTWTCVLWLQAETSTQSRSLDSSSNVQSLAWKTARWTRIFQNGLIGYLMGILVFPVNDVDDSSPEGIERGLQNPYMKAWGMWAWWTFPVIWKLSNPVRESADLYLLNKKYQGNPNHPKFIAYKDYWGRVESIFTGIPMALAFSGILGDMWKNTDWKNVKRATTTVLSFLAWFFDFITYFLSDPKFPKKYVWKTLYTMCMLYQGRVSYMESNSVIGLMGGTDGPGITWNVTPVDLLSDENSSATFGKGLDVAGFGLVKPDLEVPLIDEELKSSFTVPIEVVESTESRLPTS